MGDMMTPEQELARRIYRDAWHTIVRKTFNRRKPNINDKIIEHILLDHIDFYSPDELSKISYRDWITTQYIFENGKRRYGGKASWSVFQNMLTLYKKREAYLIGVCGKYHLKDQIKSHYGAK
jgi:hypothetical protein